MIESLTNNFILRDSLHYGRKKSETLNIFIALNFMSKRNVWIVFDLLVDSTLGSQFISQIINK